MVSFHRKGRDGGDQVENCCCKASEEITPGPADPEYVVLQATWVDDKEENTKDQLSLWQVVVFCGPEAAQNHYAEYNLSYQENCLLGAQEVGKGGPQAGGWGVLGIHHGVSNSPWGVKRICSFAGKFEDAAHSDVLPAV